MILIVFYGVDNSKICASFEVCCGILKYVNRAFMRLFLEEEIIYKRQEGTPTKYEGNSVEEALSAGLTDLHVTRAQVDVHVISKGKKGFLGIGKKLAAVEVTVKQAKRSEKSAPEKENRPKYQAVKEATADQAQKEKSSVQKKQVKAAPKQQSKAASVSAKAQEKPDTSFEDVLVDLGNYLAEVTKKMGISATINVTPEKHTVYYDFETEQEGLLIGKRGKNLNSLQLLAQDFLDKRVRRRVRVILDVANYRDRRAETLSHLAQKTARDAIAAGKPITLDPMPALERKVIHTSLADNEHVKTYSRGNEPRRAVVVDPQ